jgi:hypothetical protein
MLLESGGTMTEQDPTQPPYDPFAYAPPEPVPAPVDSVYGRFEPLAPSPEPPKRRRGLAIGLSVGGAVLVCVAVAAALAAGKSPDAHAVIQTTAEPTAGLGTAIHSHGITLVLPPDWTNLPTSPAQLQAMASAAASTNPSLAKVLAQFAKSTSLSHFAMMAARTRTDPSEAIENVNVVVGSSGNLSLDQLSSGTESQLAAVGASDLSLTDATVGSLPAFSLKYTLTLKTATGTVAVPAVVFGVVENGELAAITFTNPTAQDEKQDILDSFSFH